MCAFLFGFVCINGHYSPSMKLRHQGAAWKWDDMGLLTNIQCGARTMNIELGSDMAQMDLGRPVFLLGTLFTLI